MHFVFSTNETAFLCDGIIRLLLFHLIKKGDEIYGLQFIFNINL